ncbi:hypothetical protein TKK_0008686 [Trichogramma kaykai]
MTSRRAAGPGEQPPVQSSGKPEQQPAGDQPQASSSRQDLPPPVPPRTPQVRQQQRRPAPPVPTAAAAAAGVSRTPPPVPARPSPAKIPKAAPVAVQEDSDSVFAEDERSHDICMSVELPEVPRLPSSSDISIEQQQQQQQQQQDTSTTSDDDDDDDDPPTVLFAKCGRSASRQRSDDDDDDNENVRDLVEEEVVDGHDEPGTSRAWASRGGTQRGASQRLRPPLAGTAGVSADSGTGGDTGSTEVPCDAATHQQQADVSGGGGGDPRATAADDEEPDDDEADEVADDELARNLDEQILRGLRRRRGPNGDEFYDEYDDNDGELVTPDSVARMPAGTSATTHAAAAKTAKQQVKPFTKDSRDRQGSRHVQLVRDYGFQPKRKTSVEDGGVLPNKFEPFPGNLYNRPLEEIDSFIYDEVSARDITITRLRKPSTTAIHDMRLCGRTD